MPLDPFNLALELSTPHAQIALGRGEGVIAVQDLPARQRSNLELMPTIDMLCREHHLQPAQIAECYVSLGPGSFTGLRVAVATAHMFAFARGVKLVGVATLDILLDQHPGHAVALNVKRDTAWSAAPGHPPDFRTVQQLLAFGFPLVMDTPFHSQSEIENLQSKITSPRPLADTLYRLARAKAARLGYDDPPTLLPLYQREPEAVTLWNQRHGPA